MNSDIGMNTRIKGYHEEYQDAPKTKVKNFNLCVLLNFRKNVEIL